jgi:hypothetical protein
MPTNMIIGELFPLKGYWWQVADVRQENGEPQVILVPKKKTVGRIVLDDTTKRWKKRHPKAR